MSGASTAAVTAERIYRDYYDKVLWLVISKVNDRDLAEDIAGDVFLKVTRNLDRFDPSKSSISTWVYTITNRTLTDFYRTRRILVKLPEENGEEGSFPETLIDEASLDRDLLIQEQLDELVQAMKLLPERERDLIVLHYYSGITLKEVASRMGMSYANAKVVHKKALNHLKDTMGDTI